MHQAGGRRVLDAIAGDVSTSLSADQNATVVRTGTAVADKA